MLAFGNSHMCFNAQQLEVFSTVKIDWGFLCNDLGYDYAKF